MDAVIWSVVLCGLALSLLGLFQKSGPSGALGFAGRARYPLLILSLGFMLWCAEWVKHLGSVAGESSDPSQRAVVLIADTSPPSVLALAAILMGYVVTMLVWRRQRAAG